MTVDATDDATDALAALAARQLARRRARNAVRRCSVARTVFALTSLICFARALARLETRVRAPAPPVTPLWRRSGVAPPARDASLGKEAALGALALAAAAAAARRRERAEDALASVGAGGANDVELQTAHAASAGGIWRALKTGSEDEVKALCERDGEKALRERGPVGETPLHLMLLYGGASSMERSAQLRSAKYVGEKFPKTVNDVYVGGEYFGESALHIAIVNKNVDLVRWLLATSVNVKGLLAARATGRFFSRGAPCYYGEFALSFAASTGQGDLVEILLAAGADATAQDTHGNTCLHMAVIHNQPDMFTLICEKWERGKNEANGSSLERLSNADGLSPMLFAARSGFKDMFEFLLNRTCITEWAYGPVTCQRMPLLDVDTRQRIGTGALAEIIANGHLDLLSIPLIQELLQRKWDFYIGRLFYERVWHILAFLITMTLVHVTSYADSGLDDTLSHVAQTAKTAILGVVIAQLAAEYHHRKHMSGQSAVSVMFCVTYLASFVSRVIFHDELQADAMLAVSFLFAWFYFAWLFMGFKSIGHFVIMIYEIIMDDVRPFLSILGIFVVAFSTAIYVVLRPTSARSVRDFSGQLVTCFEWLTNGGYEGDVVDAAERGKVLMGFLMAAFTILGAVVLLNLLVAMMGDTYAKVSENAVAKWRLERARIMLRLERHFSTPHRDRLARGVWIVLDGARFLQVQLVDGLTSYEQRDARD